MPSTVYKLEDIPPNSTWIYELTAEDAITQCMLLNINPAPTLSENRALLSNYRKQSTPSQAIAQSQGSQQDHNNLLDESQHLKSEETPQKPEPNQNQGPDWSGLIQETAKAVALQVAQLQLSVPTTTINSTLSPTILDLARNTSVTSGSEPLDLLRFLVKLKLALKLDLTSHQQLLLSFLPRTEGQLRVLWTDAIATRLDAHQTIDLILSTFYPPHTRHQLLTKTVYRPQAFNETFADFINEVREFSQLLLPQISETELINTVLIGLNNTSRSALAGFPPPTTFAQLSALSQTVATIVRLHAPSPPNSQQTPDPRIFRPPPQRPQWVPPTVRSQPNTARHAPAYRSQGFTQYRPSNRNQLNPSGRR